MSDRLIILSPLAEPAVSSLVAIYAGVAQVAVIRDLAGLEASVIDENTSLLSFGSGVIVPKDILGQLRKPAYNLHAGSPNYPGRDPHHHAVYDGARMYGATLHIMNQKVDAGPIVAVEDFDVPDSASPAELLALANEAGMRILHRLGTRLLALDPLPAMAGVNWGGRKTTRADFHAACRVNALIGEDEFQRRLRAFDGGAHDNLTTELHGQTFRIDKNTRPQFVNEGRWQDFTESAYISILAALVRQNYEFSTFGANSEHKHVLLRHDVDFSLQRSLRMAELEVAYNARATYFVNPRSEFYSIAEPQAVKVAKEILARGHKIGLHFDSAAYDAVEWSYLELRDALHRERMLLEAIVEHRVNAVSWHNPDTTNLLNFKDDEIAGLINVYSARFREGYVYASDSNGYWRFNAMANVIAEGHPRLHLLTHPGWWTPLPLSPSDRIDRALLGRARAVRQRYDALLTRSGRNNILG